MGTKVNVEGLLEFELTHYEVALLHVNHYAAGNPLILIVIKRIGLYMNSDKTEFSSFNQWSAILSLNDKSLKLVDQLIYFGNHISSTERDVNICMVKHGLVLTDISAKINLE